jgi:hypothetical protein
VLALATPRWVAGAGDSRQPEAGLGLEQPCYPAGEHEAGEWEHSVDCSLGADKSAAGRAADTVAAAHIAAAEDRADKPVGTVGSEEQQVRAAALTPAGRVAGLDEEDVLPAVAAGSRDPWWRVLTVWWQESN